MWFLWSAAIVFLTSGCAPLVVGGAAVGTGTGTYFYVSGEMQCDYPYPFDKVWAACEKTIADMRAFNVEPRKEIGKGTISSVIRDKKVRFVITYKAKNVTTVSIRVGIFGDKTACQLLHDNIAENISRN
jgi:hypothetical protein